MHAAHLITPLRRFSFCPAPAYSNFLPRPSSPRRIVEHGVYVCAFTRNANPSIAPNIRVSEIKFVFVQLRIKKMTREYFSYNFSPLSDGFLTRISVKFRFVLNYLFLSLRFVFVLFLFVKGERLRLTYVTNIVYLF